MKWLLFVFLLTLASCSQPLGWGGNSGTLNVTSRKEGVNLLFYVNDDVASILSLVNSLEEAFNSDKNVSVLVLASTPESSSLYSIVSDSTSDIISEDILVSSGLTVDSGRVNMSGVLKEFLDYGRRQSLFQTQVLVIRGRTGSWRHFMTDYHSAGDKLTANKVSGDSDAPLNTISTDLVVLDTDHGAMIETLYQFSLSGTPWMVAGQGRAYGYDYSALLGSLNSSSSFAGETVGSLFVDNYAEYNSGKSGAETALFNLSGVRTLIPSFKALNVNAEERIIDAASQEALLNMLYKECLSYYSESNELFLDLWHMANEMEGLYSDASLSQTLKSQLESTSLITKKWAVDGLNAKGLSVYFTDTINTAEISPGVEPNAFYSRGKGALAFIDTADTSWVPEESDTEGSGLLYALWKKSF